MASDTFKGKNQVSSSLFMNLLEREVSAYGAFVMLQIILHHSFSHVGVHSLIAFLNLRLIEARYNKVLL